ncbi:hypothetical protein BDV27DRAFT_162638 [Aspergillus caelatus]|uniref:Uncharacterized protein n=1 Tax=Aspergillus caelatus TaxID=61420 RepID=A0A5N6ZQE0_9EURO|nr:uncharacterized protein BDV27DRAFT_162638 [Aspergillus caelatus]KAE8359443.1 hypothetical protein BDV27DRAFT_162638 [Aspergillus caelatus]
MDIPTKALANLLGHGLLSELREIRRAVGNLTKRVAPYREIRKSILNIGVSTTGLPQSQRRNEAAYGANIREDYFLIMEEKDKSVADSWRRVFKDIYGFQLSGLEDRIPIAPDRVIEAFNMYGNCRMLHRWKGYDEVKQKVLNKCHELLLPWVTKTEPDDYLQNKSPSFLLYRQIISLYESV